MIALDSGHSTITAGKRTPDGIREIEFNYPTKRYIMQELTRLKIPYVDCSPDKNIDYSLTSRANTANNAKAAIFVSIHYNAYGDGKTYNNVKGIETFHFPASTGGKLLATHVHNELIKDTKQVDRGVKEAKFTVLHKTKMPAILAECGFMTNKQDAKLMTSPVYQKLCAIAITKGICKYMGYTYTPAPTTSAPTTRKDYQTILKEVSQWSKIWIDFIDKNHSKDLNLKGLIELLYYTKGS
jgi:N-acetylmuramoyl-L-alanine amidase